MRDHGRACDDTQVVTSAEEATAGAEATPSEPHTPTIDCAAAILNRVDSKWRARSVARGRFGLYGDSGDLRTVDRWGRAAFWTKIPVILDGHREATLRVAARDRHRVGLTYGPSSSSPATSKDGAHALSARPERCRSCRVRTARRPPGPAASSSLIA
jgi:hypothetical protein